MVRRANDYRIESYTPDPDTIEVLGDPLTTANYWADRKEIILPLRARSLCELAKTSEANDYRQPTLGVFKPGHVLGLRLGSDSAEWSPTELGRLRQTSFLDDAPERELEKIPFKFVYRFLCAEPHCRMGPAAPHELSCVDWEMAQSYRRWRNKYGCDWKRKFMDKYQRWMIDDREVHFIVGTMKAHPSSWIIVGLFYPPNLQLDTQPSLF